MGGGHEGDAPNSSTQYFKHPRPLQNRPAGTTEGSSYLNKEEAKKCTAPERHKTGKGEYLATTARKGTEKTREDHKDDAFTGLTRKTRQPP